jgi:hypothetical protein
LRKNLVGTCSLPARSLWLESIPAVARNILALNFADVVSKFSSGKI